MIMMTTTTIAGVPGTAMRAAGLQWAGEWVCGPPGAVTLAGIIIMIIPAAVIVPAAAARPADAPAHENGVMGWHGMQRAVV